MDKCRLGGEGEFKYFVNWGSSARFYAGEGLTGIQNRKIKLL